MSASASSVKAGLATARERLARGATRGLVWLGVALTVTAALVERHVASAGAVDRAVLPVLRVVVPVVVMGLVGVALGHERLDRATRPLARFGLEPSLAGAGQGLVCLAVGALVGGSAGALAVLFAHTPAAAPLGSDLLLTARVGALGGAAYAGVFFAASGALARGRLRLVLLALDLLLGASGLTAALLLPGPHVRSLAGGAPAGTLGQPASSAALAGLAALGLALGAALARRGERR